MSRFFFIAGLAAALCCAAAGVSHAAERAQEETLESRVAEILRNQEKIIADLEEIKKELRIVKIRAS